MNSSSHDQTPHALVVPSSGQGHVVGAMLLSQSLAALGFKISYVYFSSYYASLKERNRLVLPTPELRGDTLITSSRLHGGSSNGDGTTSVAPYVHIGSGVEVEKSSPSKTSGISGAGGRRAGDGRGKIYLYVVDDGLAPGDVDKRFDIDTSAMKESLHNLIVELREKFQPPTCLISDTFVPWTLEIAQGAGIPRIELCTANALSHLAVTNVGVLYSGGIFPEKGSPQQWKRETPLMLSHVPGLPPFSSELMPKNLRFVDSSSHFSVEFFNKVGSCVKSGERVLINTLAELEPDAFHAFQVQGIPAYAIGPLPTQMKKQDDIVQAECLSWLDLQAEYSVIYVAFGSSAELSVGEIQELAMGLEASGSPFLWVVRQDAVRLMEDLPQVLPGGFLERTSGKGMIISWAPQPEVLAHRAVGGFLSHCGWNSTVESLWAGVPILCCPRFAEQRFNSHYLCNEWGAGLELARTDTGGLQRSFVEDGVKALLHSEEGLKARSKAQEIMHLIEKTSREGGQSFSNLQKLYVDMEALCASQTSAK